MRIGITPDSPEKRAKFDTQMAIAEMDRKRLGVVAAYVVEKSGDKKALRNYRYIAKGSGPIDTLTDNLGLSALVRQFPEMASQIKPGGQAVDAKYLDEATARAVELLAMSGYVMERGVPQNVAVDRQNRLLTLCMQAQSDIKKFAAAAFFDNIEYYNSNYASDIRPQTPDAAAVETQETAAA